MGFSEGIGAIAMMGLAIGPLILVTNLIPGMAASPLNETVVIFTLLGWVMTSFTGKEVGGTHAAIAAGAGAYKTAEITYSLNQALENLKGKNK